MEYAILALCIVIVGLLVVIILMKNKKTEETTKFDDSSLIKSQAEFNGEIRSKLDGLKGDLENYLQKSIKDEIITLKNELNDSNTTNRKTIEEFKTNITENLNNKFQDINEKLNEKIVEILKNTQTTLEGGFEKTSKSYADLVEQLTLISQAKENIESLSTEVISLKSVLENNQNRGKFGEFALERILFSIFGDAKDGVYEFQYKLKNYDENERPDAVIFLPEPNKLLCIDSKFPFADYRGIIEATSDEERETCQKGFGMAVKKHITDIANKYIIKNTTAEYALMFVPSDAVFGYINSQLINVVEYARSKNVILTSPSTLQPILATINLVKIQYERKKNIDNILKSINALSKKFTQFTNGWDQLSKTVAKLDEHRMAVDKNVRNLSEQFDKIESVKVIEMNNNEE